MRSALSVPEGRILAIEAKSGATIASDWFAGLAQVRSLVPGCAAGAVIHGGDEYQERSTGNAVPIGALGDLLERFDGRR